MRGATFLVVLGVSFSVMTAQNVRDISGDWSVTTQDAGGVMKHGAWRITQTSTQLEVVSRWSHLQTLRQSSGTISESGRVLIIGGPTDGWMESFSGMLSADGNEISGTWSRVEGVSSTKGSFAAQRQSPAGAAPTPEPPAAPPAAPAPPETRGRVLIEAPGSQPTPPPPAGLPPVPAPAPVREPEPFTRPAEPPPREPVVPPAAPPPVRRPADQPPAGQLSELEALLALLIEENQLVIRQAADVRNTAPNKDRALTAQLEKQRRIYQLIERLIHSKVELEELLELYRRGNQVP